jgi:hypothetical protein
MAQKLCTINRYVIPYVHNMVFGLYITFAAILHFFLEELHQIHYDQIQTLVIYSKLMKGKRNK